MNPVHLEYAYSALAALLASGGAVGVAVLPARSWRLLGLLAAVCGVAGLFAAMGGLVAAAVLLATVGSLSTALWWKSLSHRQRLGGPYRYGIGAIGAVLGIGVLLCGQEGYAAGMAVPAGLLPGAALLGVSLVAVLLLIGWRR